MPELTIADAQRSDLRDICDLLEAAGLSADEAESCLGGFLVAREDDRVVGTACLESHGVSGLLRSVAVAPDRRGLGIAARMVEHLIARSRAHRHTAVYLLTTTAQGYFERLGFRRIDRASVDPPVRASGQFVGQTCASAAAMAIEFGPRPV